MSQSHGDRPAASSPVPNDPLEVFLLAAINDPTFNDSYGYQLPQDFFLTDFFFDDPAQSVDGHQQSSAVSPPVTLRSANETQLSSQGRQQQLVVQPNGSESRKIRIKTQPRSKFRPRTKKESEESAHYIRSEDNVHPGYPSIYLEESWRGQNYIIEVTLVDKNGQPHPYTIDNKERKTSSLICKGKEDNKLYYHNTLYYRVTDQDFQKGEKIFLMEYIKAKQENGITKEVIKTGQLYQSMLRFTLCYPLSDGSYQRDEASVEYSCIMTEDYGGLTVEDVFPLYGPMRGNHKVCIETKGFLPKDLKTDLTVTVIEPQTRWSHQIKDINRNRNNFIFVMPPFPYSCSAPVKVILHIQYKGDTVYKSPYMYTGTLDRELPLPDIRDAVSVYSSTDIPTAKRPRQ